MSIIDEIKKSYIEDYRLANEHHDDVHYLTDEEIALMAPVSNKEIIMAVEFYLQLLKKDINLLEDELIKIKNKFYGQEKFEQEKDILIELRMKRNQYLKEEKELKEFITPIEKTIDLDNLDLNIQSKVK